MLSHRGLPLLQVDLLLFDQAAGGTPQVLAMQQAEQGVWQVQVSCLLVL